MPIQRVVKNGKTGFRFGNSGKIYYYKPGNEASRKRAKAKAAKQEQAIRSTGWREK